MNRPKRAAATQRKTAIKQPDLDLSDIDQDEDSDGDFSSQSSDEYNPNDTSKNEEISEESEVASEAGSDEEDEEEPDSSPEKHQKPQSSRHCRNNNNGKARKSIATLRKEVLSKFRNSSCQSNNSKLQDVLKKAEFQKRKSIFSQSNSDDENTLKGAKLSDSSDSEGDEEASERPKKPKSTKSVLAAKKVALQDESDNDAESNIQKMREIAEKLAGTSNAPMTYKSSQKENMDVADLLAMGEEEGSKPKSKKRARATQADESDSDNWEDVEDDGDEKVKVSKDGVEILLNDFGNNQKRDKKPVDVEAQVKRKINRARKEHQERLHKSQLLAWIGHCNFVNTRLNDMDLIKNALKLLPKNGKQCYPTEKTDVEYFKQITNWFKNQMKLRNKEMYCTRLKNRPPLMMSLALQMKFQKAICRRDYVLIFVILLRAIGIQCRMVQSLNCEPKMCPKTELMSLSKKPAAKGTTKSSSASNKSRTSKSKAKVKIPQLDGGDNGIPPRRTTRKALKDNEEENGSKKAATFKPAKITVSVDSPNRIQKTSSKSAATSNEKLSIAAKLSRAAEMSKNKATLKVFSPRKTRSMSHDDKPSIKPSTSKNSISSKDQKEDEKKTQKTSSKGGSKDTLKIVLPKGTRSRSNSSEKPIEKKNSPNLKKLAEKRKATDDPAPIPLKSRRETKTTARTSSSKENETKSPEMKRASRKRETSSKTETTDSKKSRKTNASESSDGSLKYFKKSVVKSVSKTSLNSSTTSSKAPSKFNTSIKDTRVLSSDDEEALNQALSPRKKKQGIDIWIEVYAEKEERWISIDVLQAKVDCPKEIAKKASHPLTYVFAWNNDNSIKDISARYVDKLNSAAVRKTRVDREYLNSVLHLFTGVRTARDFKEDTELNDILLAETMPKSISEFKNHPLYALKRHLLKFEVIYPPEPPILGYIRDEAIYPRDTVFVCRSRESWLKEARVVKLNEKPYKITTTMRWDKAKSKVIRDIPLEIFGIWQTKDYEPPVAENGVVPRNGYGNVELFKPCMLPINTVHIQLPGLNKVCKKLGIDCAQAVIGFDSNGGWPYPVYDGFIVCSEFEEKVIDAWNRDQDEMEKKEREKIEKRVYGNWKKLIKGLWIRERLKIKYNFEQGK